MESISTSAQSSATNVASTFHQEQRELFRLKWGKEARHVKNWTEPYGIFTSTGRLLTSKSPSGLFEKYYNEERKSPILLLRKHEYGYIRRSVAIDYSKDQGDLVKQDLLVKLNDATGKNRVQLQVTLSELLLLREYCNQETLNESFDHYCTKTQFYLKYKVKPETLCAAMESLKEKIFLAVSNISDHLILEREAA